MSPEERALNATRSQAPWDAFLAALVPQIAEQIRWAIAAEREACAKLCEAAFNDSRHGLEACNLADHLANVIRARGQQ